MEGSGARPRTGSIQKITDRDPGGQKLPDPDTDRNTALLHLIVEWDVFRELEEAKDDESFLDEECEDRWTEADKRLMGPLLGENYWHQCCGSGMFMNENPRFGILFEPCYIVPLFFVYDLKP